VRSPHAQRAPRSPGDRRDFDGETMCARAPLAGCHPLVKEVRFSADNNDDSGPEGTPSPYSRNRHQGPSGGL